MQNLVFEVVNMTSFDAITGLKPRSWMTLSRDANAISELIPISSRTFDMRHHEPHADQRRLEL
jgi:hypothetical protein